MRTIRLIFSDADARAIVAGRKTVTRRPVGVPNDAVLVGPSRFELAGVSRRVGGYALPGDLLIGRECWAESVPGCEFQGGFAYRADHNDKRGDGPSHPMRWRPSIHMPDRAARIRRRVVSVTVERLQDITEADAVREGVERDERGWLNPRRNRANSTATVHSARQAFRLMWDDVYGSRGLGWDVNPWVWPIEFEGPK
jgi:hypothetical protein